MTADRAALVTNRAGVRSGIVTPAVLSPASETWRKSAIARVPAINDMLDTATADLSLEQMNYSERAGVLSLAFSLIHVVGTQGRNVSHFITRTPSLWSVTVRAAVALWRRGARPWRSPPRAERALDLSDATLVPRVERPLLDAFAPDEPCAAEDAQVLAGGPCGRQDDDTQD